MYTMKLGKTADCLQGVCYISYQAETFFLFYKEVKCIYALCQQVSSNCWDVMLKGVYHHHHHQPINVPTAGAQAFLMDYT
jgi:hypothetical protein